MTKIGDLATEIYDYEFGYETGDARITEISLVSGWLYGHLGELNTYIFTCFSGENPNKFDLEAQAILKEMYICEWYRKEHRNQLRGVGSSSTTETSVSNDWEVIREGDSMIKRKTSAKGETSKVVKNYQDAIDASTQRFKDLVYAYNLYGANPSQVVGKDSPIKTDSDLDNYYD